MYDTEREREKELGSTAFEPKPQIGSIKAAITARKYLPNQSLLRVL